MRAWKTRFPKDDPPDLDLDFSGSAAVEGNSINSQTAPPPPNKVTLQEALKEHEEKVKVLQKQLYQSEFVVSFLWELMREESTNNNKPQGTAKPKEEDADTVDGGVELEDSHSASESSKSNVKVSSLKEDTHVVDTEINQLGLDPVSQRRQTTPVDVSTVQRKESVRNLVNNFEKQEDVPCSPNKVVGPIVNKGIPTLERTPEDTVTEPAGANPSTGNFVFSNFKKNKHRPPLTKTYSDPSSVVVKPKLAPIPAPRPSKRGPVLGNQQRHSACPLTESICEQSEFVDQSIVERPTISPRPVSGLLQEGSHQVAVVPPCVNTNTTEVPVSKQSDKAPNGEVPKSKVSKPPRLRPLKRSGRSKSKEAQSPVSLTSPDSDLQAARDNNRDGSMKRSQVPRAPYDNVTIPLSPRQGNSDDEVIYDEPIPVSKSDAESESSSEDEDPIYYNILLMKHQSLNHVSMNAETIYASVDLQKKKLEQNAKRLSRRFSSSDDEMQSKSSQGSSYMPSLPEDGQMPFVQLDVGKCRLEHVE